MKVDTYGVDSGVCLGSGGRMVASCGWAHARRKFDEAKSSHPVLSAEALAFVQRLYDIENRAREFSPADRHAVRQGEAAPLVGRLRIWLDRQLVMALPKLKFGEAVRSLHNQWEPWVNYLADGRLPIGNNATERDLRAVTIDRNNWLFIGGPEAGPRAAVLYTLVASAARRNLEVWAYLRDVLERLAVLREACPGGGSRVPPQALENRPGLAEPSRPAARLLADEQLKPLLPADEHLTPLLPNVWAEADPESVRHFRQHERESRAAATPTRREKRPALARAKSARLTNG